MNEFSWRTRRASLEKFRQHTFDVLIIGGGITGAGLALDAAVRGLKTALVEKRDFLFHAILKELEVFAPQSTDNRAAFFTNDLYVQHHQISVDLDGFVCGRRVLYRRLRTKRPRGQP